MASAAGSSLRTFLRRNTGIFTRSGALNPRGMKGAAPCRNAVTSSSGAILPKPSKVPLGLTRISVVVVPFLYFGTQISKSFAALLEEHDIFVPDDDDDD